MKIVRNFFKKNLLLFLLIIISFIPLLDLLRPGLPVTHDGQDHVARIANFYENLTQGILVPRWGANLNWGYGHPVLMFLYPLPSYLASLFHVFGLSFVDSVKLVFGVSFIASGITMYLWARNVFGEIGGFVTALLYIFAPYRFVDLYVRGAIGEHVAFIFPPLVFYFLERLSQKYSYWYVFGGALSIAGLILAHNAITIMFLPFVLGYAGYLVWGAKRTVKSRLLYQYTSILVLGIGLSSFFLLPAYFEGKYTLRDIVTAKEYGTRFVEPTKFFYTPWSYGGTGELSVEIGIVQLIFIVASLVWFAKFSRKQTRLVPLFVLSLGAFVLSLFIMTTVSKFLWDTITTLQKFQFPWRFLSVTVFSSAVLAGFGLKVIPEKFQKYAVFGVLIFVLLVTNKGWYAKNFQERPENFYTGVYYGTTDTGESSPIWSVRFMEKEADAPIELLSGNAAITIIKRAITEHIYEIDVKEHSRILENTLYFPGWNVYIDDKQLPLEQIEFQDQLHRGLITFPVDPGVHIVSLRFEDTRLRTAANSISLVTIFLLLFLFIAERTKLIKFS